MRRRSRRQFLRLAAETAGAAAALSIVPPSIRRALAIAPASVTGTIDDVQHVVILMQENRSFDHYFGTLRGVRGLGDRMAIPLRGGGDVWRQPDGKGGVVEPFHLDTATTSAQKVHDLWHSWEDTQAAVAEGRWDRWVPSKGPLTMGHYRRGDIPFQFALAEAFTLCDAYHCSLLGPTTPNRVFLWAGGNDPSGAGGGPVIDNSSGNALDPRPNSTRPGQGPRYTFTTYPERLEAASIDWKIYQDTGNNFSGLLNPCVAFAPYNSATADSPLRQKAMTTRPVEELRRDVERGTLPQVAWVCATGRLCEHPASSSPIEGAYFMQQVLDALTANPEVWSSTVLFITYDENDGFFDHAPAPAPPRYDIDGRRRGLSTAATDGDIHRADLRPYGLGMRVPMLVLSPWSKGGWVNSQVFDHTSVIRFLERRFGVAEPNITPWRRAVCGDLTSCFDFAHPVDPALPPLPDASDAAAIVATQRKLPPPHPPATPARAVQEPGTRPSRALPYELHVTARVADGGRIALDFGNTGGAGAVFHVYDKRDLAALPRLYTVEPGKTLGDLWPLSETGAYDLFVIAPNGFLRHFSGRAGGVTFAVRYDAGGGAVVLAIENHGKTPVAMLVRANAYRADGPWPVTVAPGAAAEQRFALGASYFWYDFTVSAAGEADAALRFAGRMETGAHGISDPALAG